MKKQGEKTLGQAVPKPLSRRTGGEVRIEDRVTNPETSHNLSPEENLSVITALKKGTSEETVKPGRTERRKIAEP